MKKFYYNRDDPSRNNVKLRYWIKDIDGKNLGSCHQIGILIFPTVESMKNFNNINTGLKLLFFLDSQ